MKSGIIVFVVATALVTVNADLTAEQRVAIVENGKACMTESGVDLGLIVRARQGSFSDDATLKEFIFCMSRKFGFQNEAGEFQRDVILQKLGAALDDLDVANHLLDKCLLVEGTSEDAAFASFKCYYDSTPTHLTVF